MAPSNNDGLASLHGQDYTVKVRCRRRRRRRHDSDEGDEGDEGDDDDDSDGGGGDVDEDDEDDAFASGHYIVIPFWLYTIRMRSLAIASPPRRSECIHSIIPHQSM